MISIFCYSTIALLLQLSLHPYPAATAFLSPPSKCVTTSNVVQSSNCGSSKRIDSKVQLILHLFTPNQSSGNGTGGRKTLNQKCVLSFKNKDDINEQLQVQQEVQQESTVTGDATTAATSTLSEKDTNNIAINDQELKKEELPSMSLSSPSSFLENIFVSLGLQNKNGQESEYNRPPPIKVEDSSLLFYDVFLLLNLSVSISFWAVHRMSILEIAPAFSEGSLLSILWIISGLRNGAFLFSAIDAHYDIRKEKEAQSGGPKAAAILGLSTFIITANLRIIIALVMAFVEHRPVGVANGEELIPLEVGCGLILMSGWRMLHSSYIPRL